MTAIDVMAVKDVAAAIARLLFDTAYSSETFLAGFLVET